MARTTVDLVKAVISTTLEDTNIEQYIDSASALIDVWFKGVSASEDMLSELERWIAAHLIASTKERQAREEGAGGAYIKYSGMYGIGLKSTTYGQTAISLDTTNTLKGITGGALYFKSF